MYKSKNVSALSSSQIVLRIAIIISIAEMIIMLSLRYVNEDIDSSLVAVIDVVILVIISTPVVYLWVIKPFVNAYHDAMIKLKEMAFSDPLTGLPNRRSLIDFLEKIISECKRHKFHGAVMLIDLDGFKAVNDSYGHDAGDAVLVEISNRLTENIRTEDMAARIGGDEFVILLNHLNQDLKIAKQQAKEKARRLQQELIKNIEFDSNQFNIGASFGVRILSSECGGVEAVIREADVSMYHAKQSGKGLIEVFDKSSS